MRKYKSGCSMCRSWTLSVLSHSVIAANMSPGTTVRLCLESVSRLFKFPQRSRDGSFESRWRFGSCFLVCFWLVPFPFYLFKLHSTTTSILHFHGEDGEPCFRGSCYSSAGCFSLVSWHKSFGAVIKVLYLASHTFQKVNTSHCSCCEAAVWM